MLINSLTIDLREKAEVLSDNFIIDLKKDILHKKANPKKQTSASNIFFEFFPVFSKKVFASTIILALITMPLLNITAYEAHIINVTAQIKNDIPDIDPEGGIFCDLYPVLVTLKTTLADANIIYTLDDSDPSCPADNSNEFDYTEPFYINLTSAVTVKARSCHDGKQSALALAVFTPDRNLCPAYCGNGVLDPNEQCDDGNLENNDGCDSFCQKECVPGQEFCDGIDNDCNGLVDDNIFEEANASGTPAQAFLEDATNVTPEVSFSDDIYAVQPINIPRFIYLRWLFSGLPVGASTTFANLSLEHHENQVSMEVQWKQADNTWVDVCSPHKSKFDKISSCDLLPYLNMTDKASDVNLRLRMVCLGEGDCEEYLDWAHLEIRYKKPVVCSVCGDGKIAGAEDCDDGNTIGNDGCSATCQIEEPEMCIKINEVYYDPNSSYGDEKDEWLELYNSCNQSVNLQDWYFLDNGGMPDIETINQNYSIPGHSYVVIAANASTWSYWPLIPSNAIKIALGGNRLFRGLGDNNDRVLLYDWDGDLIDAVSWGSDTTAFDPSAPDILKGHSLSRKPAGYDTDKASDWIDTYSGSIPPGPNPGTNPHDTDGNLILPNETAVFNPNNQEMDTIDNSDELEVNPDLLFSDDNQTDIVKTPEIIIGQAEIVTNIADSVDVNIISESIDTDKAVESEDDINSNINIIKETTDTDESNQSDQADNATADENEASVPEDNNEENPANNQPAIDPTASSGGNNENNNQSEINITENTATVPEPLVLLDNISTPVPIAGE